MWLNFSPWRWKFEAWGFLLDEIHPIYIILCGLWRDEI